MLYIIYKYEHIELIKGNKNYFYCKGQYCARDFSKEAAYGSWGWRDSFYIPLPE